MKKGHKAHTLSLRPLVTLKLATSFSKSLAKWLATRAAADARTFCSFD